MGRIDYKVAVVTGGAKGIGRATCELLAREGARVAITDVEQTIGEELAASIQERGGESRYWHLDVANEKDGHLGEALDVAYGIHYLASDEAKFVTGSELVIDGGYTAR